MLKALGMLLLVTVLSVMVLGAAALPAAAQAQTSPAVGEYMNVSGMTPFTASTNFMSLTGYLRWTSSVENHVWLTRPKRSISSPRKKGSSHVRVAANRSREALALGSVSTPAHDGRLHRRKMNPTA